MVALAPDIGNGRGYANLQLESSNNSVDVGMAWSALEVRSSGRSSLTKYDSYSNVVVIR